MEGEKATCSHPTSSFRDDKELGHTGEPRVAAPSVESSPEPQTELDPVVEKDTNSAPEKKVQEQPSINVTEGGTETKQASGPQTSVGQVQAQNGGGARGSAGKATNEADHDSPASLAETVKLQPEVSAQLVSIRDQLNKVLEQYGQGSESPQSSQGPDKGGNVTIADGNKGTKPPIKTDDDSSKAAPTEKRKSDDDILMDDLEKRHKKLPGLFHSFNFCLVILLAVLASCVAWYSEREKLGTFDLENFFIQNPETAGQWERLDRRVIRILVTGKTGTGKSALINGLIGQNVTKEGDTLDPTTARVEQIKQMVHGISMSVFDSPGLQDGTSREQEYLQDMQQKCEKVDLVLYAIKMTDQRVHAADTKAMKKITNVFGQKFWEKAIFVMTFANEVRSPEYPDDEYENKKYFEKRLQDWTDKLPDIIEQRSDIPLNIGKHVPTVPAGYYKIRDLPGRKFWFSQFWKAALDRMMESSAKEAGYMLQFSQDRLKHLNDTTEEDFEKPIHEQPILSKIVDE